MVHPDYAAAARDAIELLASLGHGVEEAKPDVFDDAYNALFPVVYGPGAAWIIEYWVRKLGRKPEKDEIEPRTRANWAFRRASGRATSRKASNWPGKSRPDR